MAITLSINKVTKIHYDSRKVLLTVFINLNILECLFPFQEFILHSNQVENANAWHCLRGC